MTYLSFDNFISKARESQDGTIRIAKGDESKTQLVNKGTFGHRLATFFTSIGNAISSCFGGQPDGTRAKRNEVALEGFQKALREQFGDTVANEALQRTGLDQDGVKLTGKKIIDVSDVAKSLIRENAFHNRQMLDDCLPLDYGNDYVGGKFFGEICEGLGVSPDLAKTLPPERYDAYRERLICAFRQESSLGDKALTEDESKAIATKVLKQVLKLDGIDGRLERAQTARHELTQSVINLLSDVANDRSPRKLFESLLELNRCLAQVVDVEGLEGEDEVGVARDRAILEAMVELNHRDHGSVKHAQTNIFGPESSFRALFAVLQEAGKMDGLSRQGTMLAPGLYVLLSDIANTLGVGVGSHSKSRTHDNILLDSPEDLSRRTMDRARQTVLPHFENLKTAKSFLDELKRRPEPGGEMDRLIDHPEPRSLGDRLEAEVLRYCEKNPVSVEEACEDFRAAIERDPDLSDDLKDELYAGLLLLQNQHREVEEL